MDSNHDSDIQSVLSCRLDYSPKVSGDSPLFGLTRAVLYTTSLIVFVLHYSEIYPELALSQCAVSRERWTCTTNDLIQSETFC